mgnify:CR=1 FL=1
MKLPVVSGQEVVKALKKIGFELDHVTGSHAILRKNTAPFSRTTVPLHKELAKGTLNAILKQTRITREQLFELLD